MLSIESPDTAQATTLLMETYDCLNDALEFTLFQMVAIGTILVIIILACIIGNLFVILAILIERDLRCRPQYYLIFSLAVADLLVGLIVTPLYAWATVTKAWKLGAALCDIWITTDLLLCTSSILHLVAIALDRYWSVTDITYVQNRTPKRIFTMLAVVWVVSLLISVAPIFGWKDSNFLDRVEKQHVCLVSQQISFQIFSTATAFYIPLCAITFVYYKIMRAAKLRFKRERDRKTIRRPESNQLIIEEPENEHKILVQSSLSASGVCASSRSAVLIANGIDNDYRKKSSEAMTTITVTNCNGSSPDNKTSEDESTPVALHCDGDYDIQGKMMMTRNLIAINHVEKVRHSSAILTRFPRLKRRSKESSEMKRQRKAWRTLAIITGTFVASWTPFFLVAVYRPICGCEVPELVERLTNWLGYLNSAINPVIYTIFSLDFRNAFHKLLKRILFINDRRRTFHDFGTIRR